MNNTIEFVLRMKDMMSSSITRVGSSSQSAFNRMSRSADQVTGRNRILGMSFNELQRQIRDVENTIRSSTIPSQIAAARRELSALQHQSSRHAGNVNGSSGSSSGGIGIGGVAGGTVLGNLATSAISTIGSGISSMITGSMQKEMDIAGMSTFIGKKGAKEAYGNIQKDALATPFDTASLLVTNRSLISAGLNAKQARTDTMNLANAVVAVGGSDDTLTRMAANLQQIKNIGKATAMDVRQFGIAGINVYEMLARSTGKSIDQVKEMDVTYEQLAEAMSMAAGKGGIYENALSLAMNTQQAKWSNLKESVTKRLTEIGDAFAPVTMKVMDLGSQFANAGDYVIQFANWLTSGSVSASVFTSVIGGLAMGFLAYQSVIAFLTFKTWLLSAATWKLNAAFAANPIGIVVVAVAALVAGIVIAYNKFEKFRAIVDGVWGVLKEVGVLIKSIIMGDLSGIASSLKNIFTGKSFTNSYNESINLSAVDRHKSLKDKATKREIDKRFDASKTSPLGSAGALAASNQASGKTAGDTVAGAGPKVINISVGKFFDNIQFTTMNGKESAQELENIVMETLARVLYNGSKMV